VLDAPRWTHVAFPVKDLEASIRWYTRFTPLRVLQQRRDADGSAAWMGHPEPAHHPFVLVLVGLDADRGRDGLRQLGPFGHLGMELPSRDDVDEIADRARTDGCLVWEPSQYPPPVGYVCAASDPDGNVVEFSFDQGVYRTAYEHWGDEVGASSDPTGGTSPAPKSSSDAAEGPQAGGRRLRVVTND
jgi:catechol 2,3-dioxygenase-like lactoylglutathione lyase family enzyme